MIDPHNITDFNRTDEQLEEFLLFSVVAAGKTATTQARLLNNFLSNNCPNCGPFDTIRVLRSTYKLEEAIRKSRLGQFTRLYKSFKELALSGINLRRCSVKELEEFTGIGPKTARFFVLHSQPNEKYCIIDTHVLKFMRELGWTKIKSTPSGKVYKELEEKYIKHLESEGVTDFAAYDLGIWTKYAKPKKENNAEKTAII
jgi:thermostable 8-oxoguanine DNA glycosylase